MESIKQKFEQLTTELALMIEEGERVKKQEASLAEYDARIREREQSFDKKLAQHKEVVAALEQEKAFVLKQNEELAKREFALKKIDEKKQELVELEATTNKRIAINRNLLEELDLKLKSLENIKQRERDVAAREEQVMQEKEADRKRKAQLDQREKQLTQEKERLQKIADRYA